MKNKSLVLLFSLSLLFTACGTQSNQDSELLSQINQSQQIEIITAPASSSTYQGTETPIDWTQLDQLSTYKDFRTSLDDLMKTVPYGTGSKNGIAYINLDGNQEGNNTLYNAMMNRKFIANFYDNESVQLQLQQLISSLYTDVDSDEALPAAINAYWNLLPDAEPNYFNGGSTLTRLEAMSLLARASHQVTDSLNSTAFEEAVQTSTDTASIASLVQDDSYLTLESKSLYGLTANGTITRGEYIYMLMSNVFGQDILSRADLTSASFNDAKDGGDIASKQKFIEDGTAKDMYQAYELVYAMQNPDGGCPTRMYRALAVAQGLGIISSETRWDEGLTKTEAIQLYLDTLQAYTRENGYPVNLELGAGDGVSLADTAEEEAIKKDFTNYSMTETDMVMVATQQASVYEHPSTESVMIGILNEGDVVHIINTVDGTSWVEIEQGGGDEDIHTSFVDISVLEEYVEPEEETSAETETPAETQQPNGGSEQQPSGGGSNGGGSGGGSGSDGGSGGSGGGSNDEGGDNGNGTWQAGDTYTDADGGTVIYGGSVDF